MPSKHSHFIIKIFGTLALYCADFLQGRELIDLKKDPCDPLKPFFFFLSCWVFMKGKQSIFPGMVFKWSNFQVYNMLIKS